MEHEEHDISTLHEIEGKYYILRDSYYVFQEDPNPAIEVKEVTLEEALEFLDRP